jgi:ABC-type transporter Mla MlaB component
VPITLDQSEVQSLIRLEGEINIASATELKQLLVQALTAGKDLRLNLEQATDLDITALQLLWVFARVAKKIDMAITVPGGIPQKISAAAIDAGFERFPVPMEAT